MLRRGDDWSLDQYGSIMDSPTAAAAHASPGRSPLAAPSADKDCIRRIFNDFVVHESTATLTANDGKKPAPRRVFLSIPNNLKPSDAATASGGGLVDGKRKFTAERQQERRVLRLDEQCTPVPKPKPKQAPNASSTSRTPGSASASASSLPKLAASKPATKPAASSTSKPGSSAAAATASVQLIMQQVGFCHKRAVPHLPQGAKAVAAALPPAKRAKTGAASSSAPTTSSAASGGSGASSSGASSSSAAAEQVLRIMQEVRFCHRGATPRVGRELASPR